MRRALLTHGFASDAAGTWTDAGWPDLLADIGIEAVTFELPGHGASPLPPDTPSDEVEQALLDAAPDADILIGFSAGAMLSLRAAVARPERVARIVLMGMGDGMWTSGGFDGLADRLATSEDEHDTLFRTMAHNAGNDIASIATYLRGIPGPPPYAQLAVVTAPTLVVLGDRDTLAPADRLLEALPDARLALLPGVDHVRTPESSAAMGAVLDFLAEG